jgi:cytochrome P450
MPDIDEREDLSLSHLLEPPYAGNPYALYSRLRAADPVHWDERGSWVLTRYADVVAALRDSRLSAERFSLDVSGLPAEVQRPVRALARQMLFLDPPDHTRLRTLAAKAFTPRMVEMMRLSIQRIVDDLLDAVEPGGSFEVIDTLAFPLPAIVIAQMLGVPPEDRLQFAHWTAAFGALLDGALLTAIGLQEALVRVSALMDYFRQIIAERRSAPHDDLLQALLNAEEQGDTLSEDELLGNCILLLAAGHGTTTHLIGNGLLALLQHPDQLELLRRNPALIGSAVLELLRFDSPVQMTGRQARTDLDIGGKHIEAGQYVLACLGAANRDPQQFPDPDRLDLQRAAGKQVAFGHGIHYCLGAPLGRLEAEIALNTLLRRFPGLRLACEADMLTWLPGLVFRGLRALPVIV